jgi:hypothetical protein
MVFLTYQQLLQYCSPLLRSQLVPDLRTGHICPRYKDEPEGRPMCGQFRHRRRMTVRDGSRYLRIGLQCQPLTQEVNASEFSQSPQGFSLSSVSLQVQGTATAAKAVPVHDAKFGTEGIAAGKHRQERHDGDHGKDTGDEDEEGVVRMIRVFHDDDDEALMIVRNESAMNLGVVLWRFALLCCAVLCFAILDVSEWFELEMSKIRRITRDNQC